MKLVKDTVNKNENLKQVSDKEAEDAFRTILTWMGEDPNREGLLETPKRVVKAFKEYFKGYNEDANKILDKTFGDVEGYDDMVVQKNISVQSHCEHHMAPIIGKAHVAYIPNERVVGLSKLARVVEVFLKIFQLLLLIYLDQLLYLLVCKQHVLHLLLEPYDVRSDFGQKYFFG